MKKHIFSILGVAYVCYALIISTNSQIASINVDCPLEGHQDRVEQEDRRGDGYSQRLSGPPRTTEAERQFGWRPEYLQQAKEEAAKTQAVTPIFQPNCLILWTADWCPSCKSMYPIAKILQAEGYTVYVLDYDEHKGLAHAMRIHTLPTTLIWQNGVEVTRRTGTITLDEIKKHLKKN